MQPGNALPALILRLPDEPAVRCARYHAAAELYLSTKEAFIPGGVVSGTALIRPDFPELKEWPFLWQQTEYVLGGGSSRFMFLVLAVQDLLSSAPG